MTGERREAGGERRTWGVLRAWALAIACGLSPFASQAAFKDLGWGTRGAGMGGAQAATTDNADAPHHNPAGLARLQSRELALMYARPYAGLDLNAGANGGTSLGMNALSAAAPAGRWGSFGLSWTAFNVNGLYREDVYALSYARPLRDRLYAGVSLKSLSHRYSPDERTRQMEATSARSPFRHGTSKTAAALDLGLQALPVEKLALGLAVKNFNTPDVGLAERDRVPREVRLGAAFLPGDVGILEDLTPAMEISYRKPDGNDADLRLHFGVESWFNFHTYALRFGGNDRELTFGGSWNKDFAGLSLQMDYAFVWSSALDASDGTHRLTVALRRAVFSTETIESASFQPEPSEEAVEIPLESPPAPQREVEFDAPSPVSETASAEEPPVLEQEEPAAGFRPPRGNGRGGAGDKPVRRRKM
jgi:hypothetical protein